MPQARQGQKEFPEALKRDKTKWAGPQEVTCVNECVNPRYLFIALQNGNIRLSNNGTWIWNTR